MSRTFLQDGPFGARTRAWFESQFPEPTAVQRAGWPLLARGANALLIAPTGSGKTLAGFLAALDARMAELDAAGDDGEPHGYRIVYVSPLKALVQDIERNLHAPLAGMQNASGSLGLPAHALRIDLRTGDTPPAERARQARDPGDILVTTPESLFLMLSSQTRRTLGRVRTMLVDEVHVLAGTKRGAHLALSLERLAEAAAHDPQRIGLSATVEPAETAARWLGGSREVQVVDAAERPDLDLAVRVPVPDMTRPGDAGPGDPPRDPGGPVLAQLASGANRDRPTLTEAMQPLILDWIERYRSILVFVNSRAAAERMTQRLNEGLSGEGGPPGAPDRPAADAPGWNDADAPVRAHHGSLAPETRADVEDALRSGRARAIVATSSLELGIDMGLLELVVLVDSPGTVSRGLQRIGRAGHGVGQRSRGRLLPRHRGDLLESTVVAMGMQEGRLEPLRIPENPLDVLAQHVVALALEGPLRVERIRDLLRHTASWPDLPREALDRLLEMLAGGYRATELAGLPPSLVLERAEDRVHARRGAAWRVRMNAGTIPDRGMYGVHHGAEGARLGELDEEMVHEIRPGENLILGASLWRVEDIHRDRVIVRPAPAGEPGRLPFWRGEGPGRPPELGARIGAFLTEAGRELSRRPEGRFIRWLQEQAPLDGYAARNLFHHLAEQSHATGGLPSDGRIIVERFRDELGDWRICILSPWGARVHAPWAMALEQRLAREHGGTTPQMLHTDDGIILRTPDDGTLPGVDALFPDPDELDEWVTAALPETPVFASLFRENAARALLLPRRGPRRRTPLWAQREKAAGLLAEVREYPNFPIWLETFRQALGDVFDLPVLRRLLQDVQARRIRVHEVETEEASPFARSLVSAWMGRAVYENDTPLAERKAQALTLDRNLLAELLGHTGLRELIDADALEELEGRLQCTHPGQRADSADRVHDLLRRLGDLSEEELAERVEPATALPDWLTTLQEGRRAVRVLIAGETRWIAAEDAGLYRETLGVVPPRGLPTHGLEAPPTPWETLIRRYAQRRGPFPVSWPARRFGVAPARIEPVLGRLTAAGTLTHGEMRPDGRHAEWCDAEVLKRLKRDTLGRLRRQAAPVGAPALAAFLPEWHGIARARGGGGRLLEAVTQLEGLSVSWRALTEHWLPARVPGFRIEQLDLLAAQGEVVWVGHGALGPRDGRIALYRRSHAPALLPAMEPAAAETVPESERGGDDPVTRLGDALVAILTARGALFLTELETHVRREWPETPSDLMEEALWARVWSGELTNDTFGPLESLTRPAPRRGARTAGRARPTAGGRWSAVQSLTDPGLDPEERALLRAETLLERYGVVSREAVQHEGIPGGFRPIHQALGAMEESGRVRRGYFVEGLQGAQFARPGVVDQLRGAADREDGAGPGTMDVLTATDPANPYGSLMPWPGTPETAPRPQRRTGAWVVLQAGRPLIYAGAGVRQITTFQWTNEEQEALVRALSALLRKRITGRRALTLERIDGRRAAEADLAPALRAAGWNSHPKGLTAEPPVDRGDPNERA